MPVLPWILGAAALGGLGLYIKNQMDEDKTTQPQNPFSGPGLPWNPQGNLLEGSSAVNPYAALLGQGYPQISAPRMNFTPQAPQNYGNVLSSAAQRAYQPMIDYQKGVIPYLEQRQEANAGEIQNLRNIAEQSWIDTAGRIRTGTEQSAAKQAANTQQVVNQILEGTEGRTQGTTDFLNRLGIGATVEGATEGAKTEGAVGAGLAGAEGSIFGNLIAEQGSNAATYSDTIAGIQDTAAAADIALLAQNMSQQIFAQQGRIAQSQQAQAAAMLDAGLQGYGMYQQAYNNYVNQGMSVAQLNASMAMEAAKFNAGAQMDYLDLLQKSVEASATATENTYPEGMLGGAQKAFEAVMRGTSDPVQAQKSVTNAYNYVQNWLSENNIRIEGDITNDSLWGIKYAMMNDFRQSGLGAGDPRVEMAISVIMDSALTEKRSPIG